MRLIYSLFSIFILLSVLTSNLDAKKRSSWGGSKKSSKKISFSNTKKVSKSQYSSSFDKARDKKAKKSRAKLSYQEYKAKKESFKQGYTSSQNENLYTSTISQSQNRDNNGYRQYNGENSVNKPQPQTYFQTDKGVSKVTPAINSLYIVIGFILMIGIFLYFLTRYKSKRPITELPLDIRIGGIVNLENISSRFIINRDNFQMVKPYQLKGYITTIGKIRLDDDMSIYNIYVSENIDDKESIFTLKIELVNGVISVVKLFTNYKVIYPSTVSEWEEWLDGDEENYPNIGGLEFITPSGIKYKRVWESGVEETVRTKFIENISTEENHMDTLNIVSLYGRELESNEIEYLYVSNIEDSDLNNFIKIELGIAIKESELTII